MHISRRPYTSQMIRRRNELDESLHRYAKSIYADRWKFLQCGGG